MVILRYFLGDTQIHGQNSLMVTFSHLYFTSRAIYHHPLKCIDKFFLVNGACLLISFSDEMGSDISMKSREPRWASISSLEGFDKGFVSWGIRIIEMIVHRTHHTFRCG